MPAGGSDPVVTEPALAGVGFCGKLPSHGDFVHRRLPDTVLRPWEEWLDGGLAAARLRFADDWTRRYLACPLWRFTASASCLGEAAVAGVLMPSVDRVGRFYPLTIMAALTGDPGPAAMIAQDAWYERIEALALSCLADDFAFDAFDADIAALDGPAGSGGSDALPALTTALCRIVDGGSIPFSLWWTVGSPTLAPACLAYPALPPAESFADLFLLADSPREATVTPGR